MEEDHTKLKQAYLREQIMKKDYNPTHFANFLAKERKNGDDIGNWSLRSLREIVIQYKETFPEPPTSSEDEDEDGFEGEDSDLSEDEYKNDM